MVLLLSPCSIKPHVFAQILQVPNLLNHPALTVLGDADPVQRRPCLVSLRLLVVIYSQRLSCKAVKSTSPWHQLAVSYDVLL